LTARQITVIVLTSTREVDMHSTVMTREEARHVMIDGKKVRHFNFTSDEYLVMKGSTIMTEDGYFFGDIFDSTDWMESGWSVTK
jgi:hypothetical protein